MQFEAVPSTLNFDKMCNMKFLLFSLISLINTSIFGSNILGQLQDNEGNAISFANVALYNAADSVLVKVEISDDSGKFSLREIEAGNYYLKATYVGFADLIIEKLIVIDGEDLDLGVQKFQSAGIELDEATVTAQRRLVEVKPDRTVFNVQGTINSTGADALSLLRKAPAVTIDNNDNVSVLGRSGVMIYVDGKRLPLNGAQLSGYLKSLPSDQIDRIDIITNPGAKYEAEGNAGIIDIRMKRDKSHGTNGTISSTVSQGEKFRFNSDASVNHRNKLMNIFGSAGIGRRGGYNEMSFQNYQNGLFLDESNYSENDSDNYNFRIGTDFFVSKNHTVGFLVNGFNSDSENLSRNRTPISAQSSIEQIDSILVADNTSNSGANQLQFNVNYRLDNPKADQSLNIDLDYGQFQNTDVRNQPNLYYNSDESQLLSESNDSLDTPTDIDIYTFKVDFEQKFLGGKLGLGSKLSRVVSDNVFLFYNVNNNISTQNDQRSNIFDYDENVYAGYVSYSGNINKQWSYTTGLRAEQTDAIGSLQPFDPDLEEPPVELNYLSWFPNAGLTWNIKPMHTLALNYGRRINRPDYNVLNPFENQLSELSYEKGNPRLSPEIVNNIELGYTLMYRFNFKLAYSKTEDQITRLIAPDTEDLRAGFISWDNLASQTLISFNASLPLQIKKWWSFYLNASSAYLDNQADYGPGKGVVDVQAFTYNFYQQHTFTLPKGFKGEISSWYSGPGVWGGVFEYTPNWALNLGLSKKFLQERLNIRIAANDIFFTSGWDGFSRFNGLYSEGMGNWDSRRVSFSASYNFGNSNVKSRKRKTGLEAEADRVGGEN